MIIPRKMVSNTFTSSSDDNILLGKDKGSYLEEYQRKQMAERHSDRDWDKELDIEGGVQLEDMKDTRADTRGCKKVKL